MSKSIWRSVSILSFIVFATASAAAQDSQKLVFLRAMSREGKRVFFATESVDLKAIRRFELSSAAKVRLYFPRAPFGNLEQRNVLQKRFLALFMRKDKKQPQPISLKSPFLITVGNSKITAISQRLP